MFDTARQVLSIFKDLMIIPSCNDILSGNRMLRPFLKNQNQWIKHFHPNIDLKSCQDPWRLLQTYLMPLIKQYGSSYHVEGIKLLGLDADAVPNFAEFSDKFSKLSHGFQIQPVSHEIEPRQYFSYILDGKFPCVQRLRTVSEVFCAIEPDFWHEAIGHLAPLCFKPVQEFYSKIATCILSSDTDEVFNNNIAVAWTLTEYAFIKQNGQYRMFGAALVGSHLAHMRFLNGFLNIESANRKNIIESDFYTENTPAPRDTQGRLRFFSLDNLEVDTFFAGYSSK